MWGWISGCWLEADGPWRFVAIGYKGICTGELGSIHCGNSPVSIFYYYSFEMWGRMSFYLPERNRERWLLSPVSCKHKMCPHYLWAHKSQVCLGMESSSQVQIPVSPCFPFAVPQICFPVHLQNFATDLVISTETSSLLLALPNVTESVFALPHQTRATFCCWHTVVALLQSVTARVSWKGISYIQCKDRRLSLCCCCLFFF